jgi:hypothetical protein
MKPTVGQTRGADHRFSWSANRLWLSQRGVRASRLIRPEPGAGPSEVCGRAHHTRSHRIALDVADHVIRLARRTDPMIIRFVLPKCSASSKYSISHSTSPALQPTHDCRHRNMWLPHNVHMVRHDRPGVQIVRMLNGCAVANSVLDNLGNAGVSQPKRSRNASIEWLAPRRNSAGIFGGKNLRRVRRPGPGEAPRREDNGAIGEYMGETASIYKHGRPQKTMVCPTAENLKKQL